MKVLFTTPVLEHPAAGGPQLRIENSIKALSMVCELYIVSRVPEYAIGGSKATIFYRAFCKDFFYSPAVAGLSIMLYSWMPQWIYHRIFGKGDASFIIDIIDKNEIDVVWFGYGNISFPLIKKVKQIRPTLKVICDTDSVWSRFILRELPYEDNPKRRAKIEKNGREKEKEEKEWVNLCEVTTAVSEIDAAYYKRIADVPQRIQIFSNVIDLETYESPPLPPVGFKKPCVYLAGTFGHMNSPMDRAARWVIDDILPKVRAEIPNIHFYIVGRGTEATMSDIKDPDITITGKLPSVLPYLCHADVAIVPLKFESGTRFKILEAGACGVPIVSTTLGAEGIPVIDGRDIIVADDPNKFAQSIVKIVRDKELGRNLATNCRALIQKHYSVDSLVQEAEKILNVLKKT